MHQIEPYFLWSKYYQPSNDRRSPFYGKEYDYTTYRDTIYGYYIDPGWDYIGSETLYLKILYADYQEQSAIIEMIGEWNDTLHNDVMHLKRNVIDPMLQQGIGRYVLIGENVFNFHGSDDCYYDEWFEDVEDGWIATIGFTDHVKDEWKHYQIDNYFNYGGDLEIKNWRTRKPQELLKQVDSIITKRLPQFYE